MKNILRPALVLFLALTLLTGVAYPLVVTGAAQLLFPDQAAGSLILRGGKPVGSSLIGQNFTDDGHFWGRPSATGPMPYNASASGGSNQGPLNPALTDAVKGRVARVRGLPLDKVQQLVAQETESPWLGLLGEARVHVLRLNLALDALMPVKVPG
jgi:K+-transporting ATPase ATPase C chain